MQFNRNRTEKDILTDKVYSAMETGNHDAARTVLKEHEETFPEAVAEIRRSVQEDYGTRL